MIHDMEQDSEHDDNHECLNTKQPLWKKHRSHVYLDEDELNAWISADELNIPIE